MRIGSLLLGNAGLWARRRVRESVGKALTLRVSVERIMMKMRNPPSSTNRKPATTIQSALALIAVSGL